MKNNINLVELNNSCNKVALILKSLSHPQRLMILGYLSENQKSVSELTDLCQISQSQISQFLIRMKSEKLINSKSKGKLKLYYIEDIRIKSLIRKIINIFC